jgi:hypothetical protein
MSAPPRHPLGRGACLPGCGIRLGVCVGCLPGCLVGTGTHSGAATCQWQHHCIAAARIAMTMTMLSSPSVACAVSLHACVVSGGQRWRVPTWLLSGCCLYFSTFSLSLPFPSFPSSSFVHKSSGSLTWLSFSCEVGGCGGLVVPTITGQLCSSGNATPARVASRDVLTVVGVGEVGVACGKVVIRFNAV